MPVGSAGSKTDPQDSLALLGAKLLQADILRLSFTPAGQQIVPIAHSVISGFGLLLRPGDSEHLALVLRHHYQLTQTDHESLEAYSRFSCMFSATGGCSPRIGEALLSISLVLMKCNNHS
jgi:hypothetical protein